MYLLCNDAIVSAANDLPFLVTKKMEDLVISNSEIINAFEESILVFSFDKAFPRSIGGTLLSRFEEIINKVLIWFQISFSLYYVNWFSNFSIFAHFYS